MEINKIICGDALEVLKTMESESIDCCITSPPYWGLRDYGTAKWEGGDEKCDHKIPENEQDPKNPNAGSHISRFNKEKCHKCGAKRIDSQLGLEKTPEEYVANLVNVFREVKRVLKKDGTFWLNLGDSYSGNCSRTST
jgi:DNA modification methylase